MIGGSTRRWRKSSGGRWPGGDPGSELPVERQKVGKWGELPTQETAFAEVNTRVDTAKDMQSTGQFLECVTEAGPSTVALNTKLSSHGIWWRGEGLLFNVYTQQRDPELLPGISNMRHRLSRHKFGHIISSPFFPSPESHPHLTFGTKSSLCSLEQLLRCCKW